LGVRRHDGGGDREAADAARLLAAIDALTNRTGEPPGVTALREETRLSPARLKAAREALVGQQIIEEAPTFVTIGKGGRRPVTGLRRRAAAG
jgi:hypothetical protein